MTPRDNTNVECRAVLRCGVLYNTIRLESVLHCDIWGLYEDVTYLTMNARCVSNQHA